LISISGFRHSGASRSDEPGISRHDFWIPGSHFVRPGMTIYVSTSPVLEPLAAESFRPCGSAR
jgi:hypothetical protein